MNPIRGIRADLAARQGQIGVTERQVLTNFVSEKPEKDGQWRRTDLALTRFELAAAPPPVVHEVIDDLAELSDRAALAHEVARRRVERHHAVADAPAPLPFRIQPDDALHALAHEPERPRLRIVVVVARVAQHEDRRLAVERIELGLRELAEGESKIRPAVVVDRRSLEGPFDRA